MLGVDIGSRSIKVCELEVEDGRPVITRLASVPLAQGATGSWADPAVLPTSIEDALRAAGCKGGAALLSLPVTDLGVFGQVELPALPPKQLYEGPLWQALDSAIPFPVDHENVALSFDPSSDTANNVRVVFAALPRETLDAFESIACKAGLEPQGATLDGLAWSAWLKAAGLESSRPTLAVHVGSVTTTVLTLDRGLIRGLRWLAWGGEDITRALQEGLSLTRVDAEAVKRGEKKEPALGHAFRGWRSADAVKVAEIIATAADKLSAEILSAVQKSQERAPSDTDQVPEILLAGGSAQLRDLPVALRRRSPGPVALVKIPPNTRLGPHVDREHFMARFLSLGPVLGLALGTSPAIPLAQRRKAIPSWQHRKTPRSKSSSGSLPAASPAVMPAKKTSKVSVWVVPATLLPLGAGMVLAAILVLFEYRNFKAFESTAASTTGVVVDHRWTKSSKNSSALCCQVVEFQDQGRSIRFVSRTCSTPCEHQKGAAVEVLFQKSNPSDARLRSDGQSMPYAAAALGVFGVLQIIGGLLVVWVLKRNARRG